MRKVVRRVFCNKYNHSIDDKGRLIIPMEYRQELVGKDMPLSQPFYVTTNLWDPDGDSEACLYLWPEENFLELREKLKKVSDADSRIRKIKRRFFSNSQSTTLDKQGRVLINPELKQYAGIEKNVMLVGADEHVEVWDCEAWKRYNEEEEDSGASWSETLGALGF